MLFRDPRNLVQSPLSLRELYFPVSGNKRKRKRKRDTPIQTDVPQTAGNGTFRFVNGIGSFLKGKLNSLEVMFKKRKKICTVFSIMYDNVNNFSFNFRR